MDIKGGEVFASFSPLIRALVALSLSPYTSRSNNVSSSVGASPTSAFFDGLS